MPDRETPLPEIDWRVSGVDLDDETRAAILSRLPQLARATRDFAVTTVHVEVEHSPRKGGYGVSVGLGLPQKSLFAAEWARDPGVAGRRAMGKVAAQVSTYRALLRRHEKRSHRRELPSAPAPQATRSFAAEAALLESLRSRVARLVRHEIVHDASLADIPKEAISVPDVVDEAMVWTLENLPVRPPLLSPEQFLWRRVLHQLDLARNSVLRKRGGDEANARVAAATREAEAEVDVEWEDAQDLLFGGGEPRPLDVGEAPEHASEPGSILDREALQAAVSEALRELPDLQRRAVLLHDLEGYDPAEIAFVLHRSEDLVRDDLDAARATLRRRLRGFA